MNKKKRSRKKKHEGLWVEGGGGGAGNELGEGVREVKEREEQEKEAKIENGAGNRASLREGRREGGGG